MIFDLQKASLLKRASAYLLDLILLVIVVAGFAFFLSAITGYDDFSAQLEGYYDSYETEYGISFEITQQEYLEFDDAKKKAYDDAYAALVKDKEVIHTYNMVVNLTLTIVSLSILLSYLALEFVLPLILKNGQTVGKKIFGIAVIRPDGVKMNAIALFIRTVLGKFTIETMIPVLIIIMILFNSIGIVGPAVIGLILILQLVLVFATKNKTLIHDLLANTVAVDMQSQLIFENDEEMIEYKKKISAEQANSSSY